MKNGGLLLVYFLLIQVVGYGQKIQYSRQTFKTPNADAVQLVRDVAGNHHLLFFKYGQKPKLFVYNKLLQLHGEMELDVNLKINSAIQVLPFRNHYYLYTHSTKTEVRSLTKIDSEGRGVDLTGSLLEMLDSLNINSTANLHLVNYQQTFFILTHLYANGHKRIHSAILKIGENFKLQNSNLVSFPFDDQNEEFRQVALTGNHLLILKTRSDSARGNIVEVSKLNIHSGETLLSMFSSPSHVYQNPAFRFSEKDSTLLLYAMLREPLGSIHSQRIVFVTRLNDSLQQTTPLGLLKAQFRNQTRTNFLFVKGQEPQWLSFTNNISIFRKLSGTTQLGYWQDDISNIHPSQYRSRTYGIPSRFVLPSSIRLSVLDETFTTSRDSIVENEGLIYELQPEPYAQFTMNGKSCLVLIQNFSEKKRALVALHASGDEIITTPFPVFDRYEYNLSLLQPGNDYFILPYQHKRETGLLKITLTQ